MKNLTLAATLMLAAGAASAQSTDRALIDTDLLEQLDFRSTDFKECFEVEVCEVDGIKISGFRIDPDTEELKPAELYWDPIDGFGVTLGAQNDEIDFDERIVIELPEARTVKRVWLSDMFISEHKRYGGVSTTGEDAEYARVEMSLDGDVVNDIRVSSDVDLPLDPFDILVNENFLEDGDRWRRVVVDEELYAVVVPGAGPNSSDIVIDLDDEVEDAEKKDIFAGVPTIEVDITSLLREFVDTPVLEAGDHNADQILAALNDPERLEDLYERAKDTRVISDKSNGEIAGDLDVPVQVNTFTFYTPFDTSNDYSVAGIVFENN